MKPLTWMRLIRDSDLSATTRAVGWAIGLRAGMDGACYPSYEQIAQDTSTNRSTAIRHVKHLVEGHWLIALPRSNGHGHQANAYQLLDPRLWKTSPERLWKTPEVVAQDHQVVAQCHPLGSGTAPPRRERPIEVGNQPPPQPVDNAPLAAVVNMLSRQTRMPR